jgi:glyoxylase-like metal-dependent hydrolase (beta-lactamase superfamily II)
MRPRALKLAEIHPLRLARLTLPNSHPEGPGRCDVHAFAIREGASVVLFDSGVGYGSAIIDGIYAPERFDLEAALASRGIRLSEVRAIINSHLHFDHCGNNARLPGVPIYVQATELEASRASHYTVPEWVRFDGANYVPVEGDARISDQISIVSSPGHTPGHQSVRIHSAEGSELIIAQAAYSAEEFQAASAGDCPAAPGSWNEDMYLESRKRLVGLLPSRAFFSHDRAIWEAAT